MSHTDKAILVTIAICLVLAGPSSALMVTGSEHECGQIFGTDFAYWTVLIVAVEEFRVVPTISAIVSTTQSMTSFVVLHDVASSIT